MISNVPNTICNLQFAEEILLITFQVNYLRIFALIKCYSHKIPTQFPTVLFKTQAAALFQV